MPKVNLVILTTNCLPGLLLGTYDSEINKRRVQRCLIKRQLKRAVSLCLQVGWQHLLPSTLGAPSCPSPLQAVSGLSELGLLRLSCLLHPYFPVQDAAGCSGKPCILQLRPPYYVLVIQRET